MWNCLEGLDKDRVKRKLKLIADELYQKDSNYFGPGLMGGNSGIALFMYYYYQYTGDSKYLNKSQELMLEDFEYINHGGKLGTFASGISGILYTLDWIFRCNCASYFGDVVPLKKECFPG